MPPVDVAVKVIVFPFPWLEGSEGDDDKLGIPSAGFIIKVEEYPDETVFVPESVTKNVSKHISTIRRELEGKEEGCRDN